MSATLVALVVILMFVLICTIFGLYQKNTNAICKCKKRLDGKTVLITGGTTGMGLEIAKDFAGRGARVIIACPFENEGLEAKKQIINITGNENVVFKILDFSSFKSTRALAEDILKTEDRLDILINNAGIGVIDDFYTEDGLLCLMQVNYYGHFLLTLLLLPLLIKTGTKLEPSRIVNVSSILHRIGVCDEWNINRVGYYWPKVRIYGNSKICLVLFARELTKKLKGKNVVINSVDPGAVGTGIFRSNGMYTGQIACNLTVFLYGVLSKQPWEGAQTAIHVALDNKAGEISGEFYRDCRIYPAKKEAFDDSKAAKLWALSLRYVGLNGEDVDKNFN